MLGFDELCLYMLQLTSRSASIWNPRYKWAKHNRLNHANKNHYKPIATKSPTPFQTQSKEKQRKAKQSRAGQSKAEQHSKAKHSRAQQSTAKQKQSTETSGSLELSRRDASAPSLGLFAAYIYRGDLVLTEPRRALAVGPGRVDQHGAIDVGQARVLQHGVMWAELTHNGRERRRALAQARHHHDGEDPPPR